MKLKHLFLLFSILIIIGLSSASSALALEYCPTANPSAVSCVSGSFYCGLTAPLSSCLPGSTMTTCNNGNGFDPSAASPRASKDSCGVYNSCVSGYSICGTYPARDCIADRTSGIANCATYDQCVVNQPCKTCDSGYTLCSNACIVTPPNTCFPGQTFVPCAAEGSRCTGSVKTLKLDFDSGATSAGANIIQSSQATPSIFIGADHLVGIGTTTTNSKLLFVNGAAEFSNFAYGITPVNMPAYNQALATVEYVNASLATTSQNILDAGFWKLSGDNLFASSTSWNLGIGTNDPLSKLDIQATTTDGLIVRTNLYKTASLYNFYYDTGALDLYNKTDKRVHLNGFAPNYIMDKLGVGTTNPSTQLHVVGAVTASSYGVFNSTVINGTDGLYYAANQTGKYAFGAATTNGARPLSLHSGDATRNDGYINLLTAGVERLRVDGGGNVGIGTTTPSAPLQVMGQGRFGDLVFAGATPANTPQNLLALTTVEYVNGALSNGTGPWKRTGSSVYPSTLTDFVGVGTTNPLGSLDVAGGNILFGRGYGVRSNIDGASTRNIISHVGTTISIGEETGYYTAMNFAVNGATNALRINSGGNVGIGTTNPAYKLDVAGDIRVAQNSSFQTAGYLSVFSNNYLQLYASSGAKLSSTITGDLSIGDGASDVNMFIKAADGYVGIGTTTPGAKLSVFDTSGGSATNKDIIVLNNSGGAALQSSSIVFSNTPNTGKASIRSYLMAGGAGADLHFNTSLSSGTLVDRMTIQAAGNVGIGTTSPSKLLHVAGEGIFDSFAYGTTPVATNNYALATVEFVKSSIQTATSTFSGTGKYVGMTATAYDGNNNGNPGYVYANNACKTTAGILGSHVCSPSEMLSTIADNKPMPAVNVWLFVGPPGFTASANDCNARTLNTSNRPNARNYGTYWEGTSLGGFELGRGLVTDCDYSMPLACCK